MARQVKTKTEKICVRCGQIKPLDQFHGVKQKHSWCKPCFCAYKKTRFSQEAPERKDYRRTRAREEYAADPTVAQSAQERRRKWITPERRRYYGLRARVGDDALRVDALPDVCAICGAADHICVDHDHTTKRLRGKLCAACNKGLGFFRDNAKLLTAAIAYLQNPPARKLDD